MVSEIKENGGLRPNAALGVPTNLQPLGNRSDIGQRDWETSSRAFCLYCLFYNVGDSGLVDRKGGTKAYMDLCRTTFMLSFVHLAGHY